MAGGLRYLSVCSGIEAATVAWHPLGWSPAAFSEIEAFPRAVLAHHYPGVPCHGDFTTIGADDYGPIDLLVGGTPCQSFSVAGLRGGMADDRGNLALEYLRLADRKRPRWLVWENVPGVLSSNEGRDFGSFLGALVELGYGFAYRVLDAQFFGVAQRRRRVFVVGHLGDWRSAVSVLFERHSLQGHSAPRREKGKGASGFTPGSFGGYREGCGTLRADGGDYGGDYGGGSEALVAFSGQSLTCSSVGGVAPTLDTGAEHHNRGIHVTHALRAEGFDASEDGTGRGTPLVPVCREVAGALTSNYGKQPDSSDTALGPNLVAFNLRGREDGAQPEADPDGLAGMRAASGGSSRSYIAFAQNTRDELREMPVVGALAAQPGMKQQSYIRQASAVRRLTPVECERLQGFPDDYTLVPYRGKPAADGPRYKALGNSMAVPVMRWIGERIDLVEALATERAAA